VSHSAQYFERERVKLWIAQERQFLRQTSRPTYLLRRGLPGQGGSRDIAGRSSAGIRNRVAF